MLEKGSQLQNLQILGPGFLNNNNKKERKKEMSETKGYPIWMLLHEAQSFQNTILNVEMNRKNIVRNDQNVKVT